MSLHVTHGVHHIRCWVRTDDRPEGLRWENMSRNSSVWLSILLPFKARFVPTFSDQRNFFWQHLDENIGSLTAQSLVPAQDF